MAFTSRSLFSLLTVGFMTLAGCGGNDPGPADVADTSTQDTASPADAADTSKATGDVETDTAAPTDTAVSTDGGTPPEVLGCSASAPCPDGEICVYKTLADYLADPPVRSCVNGLADAYDDGTRVDRAFARNQNVKKGMWYRKRLGDWKEKSLRCNDGSPAGYWISPGNGKDRDNWIFEIKGGGSCKSADECSSRWSTQPSFMRQGPTSTKQFRPTYENGMADAVFARDVAENYFKDWTYVFFHYCSSDIHSGTGLATPERHGMYFRGYAIIEAVFAELLAGIDNPDNDGDGSPDSGYLVKVGSAPLEEVEGSLPHLKVANRVFIVGGSAGAGAVRRHTDRIANWIRTENKTPGLQIRAMADSALSPPIRSQTLTEEDLAGLAQNQDFFGSAGTYDAHCMEDHSDAEATCANSLHTVGGKGGTPHLDKNSKGHITYASSAETAGVTDKIFIVSAVYDGKAVASAGLKSMCVMRECDDENACPHPEEQCSNGLCLRAEPCEMAFCPGEGPCFPEGEKSCISSVATHKSRCTECEGDDCPAGPDPMFSTCSFGHWSMVAPCCQTDADCEGVNSLLKLVAEDSEVELSEGLTFFCNAAKACAAPVDAKLCAAMSEKSQDEGSQGTLDAALLGFSFSYIQDMLMCEQSTHACTMKACAPMEKVATVLETTRTPGGEIFGWAVREGVVSGEPGRVGAFLANGSHHTGAFGEKIYGKKVDNKGNFTPYAPGKIDGLTTMQALALWWEDSPDYGRRVVAPHGVGIDLTVRQITQMTTDVRAEATSCDDAAFIIALCPKGAECNTPDALQAQALFTMTVGDEGIVQNAVKDTALATSTAVNLFIYPAPGCDTSLTFKSGDYVALTYLYDDTGASGTLKVALKGTVSAGAPLGPIAIFADGSTWLKDGTKVADRIE